MMQKLNTTSALSILTILSALWLSSASAQTWKPVCVNGSNSTGNHNNTWQKINTSAAGGSTWKKAGTCVAPQPPQPPAGNPFDGVAINPSPLGYATFGNASVSIQLNTDGTWQVSGSPSFSSQNKPATGRWYAVGRFASEFEINYQATWPAPAGEFDPPNDFSANSTAGEWSSLANVWRATYTDIPFVCSGPETATVQIQIRVRANPAQVYSTRVDLQAAGQAGHCYG